MEGVATAGWLAGQAWRRDWLVGTGFFALAVLVYVPALGQYWTADDPPILASIAIHGIWKHFTSPAVWAWHQPEPPMWGVFTPWIMLSMGLDWYLGKLNPFVAYVHQLMALGFTATLLYLVLRRFFSRLSAGVACLLFLLTPPVHEAAHYLMERHYIEGLALFLASLLFYERAIQANTARHCSRCSWALASALLYFLACSAKEIYVPLAALLPLLPWSNWRTRWTMLLPHGIAAMAYLGWRAYMLSLSYLFGYGGGEIKLGIVRLLDVVRLGLTLNHMAADWQKGILVSLSLLVLFALGRSSKMAWLRALALVALAVVPLFPLLGMLQIRLYFLPMLVGAIGCAFVLEWFLDWSGRYHLTRLKVPMAIPRKPLLMGVVLFMAAPLGPAIITPHESTQKPMLDRFAQEGRFALHAITQNALLHPISWPINFWWYFSALATLRSAVLHDAQFPAICYDPCVCSALDPRHAVRAMRSGLQSTLWPVSRDSRVCGDRTSPLAVHLSVERSKGYPMLHWRLGPYGLDGFFELRLEDVENKVIGQYYPVRPIGMHPIGHGRFKVSVRWVSSLGWSSVSPPFLLTPGMPPVDWSRALPPGPSQQTSTMAPPPPS